MVEWRLVLSLGIVLLLPFCAGECSIPEFSHRTSFTTSRWFSSRARRAPQNEDEVKWWSLPKRLSNLLNNTEVLDAYRDWLHEHQRKDVYVIETDDYPVSANFLTNVNLTIGDTVFEFPIEQVITDTHDGNDLDGAPWELRLVSKLLRARSQGSTARWAQFISSLPRHVHLPMFFTEMEMQNVEDESLVNEIKQMRQFVLLSFHALRGAEILHAKFSEFVWALSIVYSLACRISGTLVSHALIPVPGLTGTKSNVNLFLENGLLKVVMNEDLRKSDVLSYYRGGSQVDAFLFQGLLIKNDSRGQAKLFSNVNDIADWFFSRYGGVNSNRYLTLKVIRDAKQAFKDMATNGLSIHPGSFSVISNGSIDLSLLCVLASLSYAKQAIDLHNINAGGEGAVDFDNSEGTEWQKMMELIARESALRVSNRSTGNQLPVAIERAFSFAEKAIQERAVALLHSYTTDVLEDELLLKAANWEGFDTSAEESCDTCRWQIDKQSWNDVLATGLRSDIKMILQTFLGRPSSRAAARDRVPSEQTRLEKFSAWCANHGLSISHKLTMTLINDSSSYQQKLVRGVVVEKDIDEGETLCTLDLDAGLYDGSSQSNLIQDSWDLAAVRLLQEKRLGASSKWADYIFILPRDIASPIYLESTELAEVQWLPVVRELIQVRTSIKKSFLRLKSSHFPFNYDEYKWAVTMVHSRAFTLPVLPDDKYSHYVLMPFMDMINHHYVYQADWMSQPVIDRKLEIVAKRPLKRGEQLFASFGPRSNDNLFLYYGFVLENNPFDSAQIFPSFKDALTWFLETWSSHCGHCSNTSHTCRSCKRNLERKTWTSVKRAIDDFEGGSTSQSRDWWELVSRWSDFGYQYLPYQPGPTVYASSVTDPSLLAAFTEASSALQLSDSVKPVDAGSNKTAHLQQFFDCMKKLQKTPSMALLNGHPCQDSLVAALESTEHGKRRDTLIAGVSVAIRCLEILATLPTTVDEDRKLLEQGSNNAHVQLAREFRYRKKLQLESVVHKLLSRGTEL